MNVQSSGLKHMLHTHLAYITHSLALSSSTAGPEDLCSAQSTASSQGRQPQYQVCSPAVLQRR